MDLQKVVQIIQEIHENEGFVSCPRFVTRNEDVHWARQFSLFGLGSISVDNKTKFMRTGEPVFRAYYFQQSKWTVWRMLKNKHEEIPEGARWVAEDSEIAVYLISKEGNSE